MLTLEIISDVVCPWCYIGLRRLSIAIEQVRTERPGFTCRKVWRPFFLNPHTPPEGEPYLPFLVAKFGSQERVESIWQHVREAGQAYGLHYAFEKIALRANTLQAHRLIHWAQQQGDAEPLVEALFQAQFERGEHVGDPVVLCKIAAACGYAGDEVARYLASDDDISDVSTDEAFFRNAGVRQVPTFLVDRRLMVVGAEDPRHLADAIRQALDESMQDATKGLPE